ncbi:signal peptide peptidase SppA [Hydrogenobacter hydrogenophilus]|uniref:Protease-4 n=1 Tax=Hydrogenobacter hydrogenophilus TaxID=35835 RepID=A0A285NPG9_9AQUI|nr:signal peptide peptidase SppA [Hydrogenobacter hydrogenophilus]SNZ11349.1 protease-4 [Hydrogenobacter hydrogenophilus]
MKKFILVLILLVGVMALTNLISRLPVGDRIAVIKVDGVIVDPEPLIKKIEKAKEDKSVKALVLRVDSPGGSVGASQEIYRALERFKESKKPIVVSMGNVAASGGYYISVPADYIYANPGTITGSIGVIIQHIDYKELLNRIGVSATAIKTGKFKDTLSPFRKLTEEEKEYLESTIEDAYQQFISAILKYRSGKISEEKLKSIADGRIMTGLMAQKVGLVDGIGNIEDAIDMAKKLSHAEKARVFYMEDRKGFLRRFLGASLPSLDLSQYGTMAYYLMK